MERLRCVVSLWCVTLWITYRRFLRSFLFHRKRASPVKFLITHLFFTSFPLLLQIATQGPSRTKGILLFYCLPNLITSQSFHASLPSFRLQSYAFLISTFFIYSQHFPTFPYSLFLFHPLASSSRVPHTFLTYFSFLPNLLPPFPSTAQQRNTRISLFLYPLFLFHPLASQPEPLPI